MMIMLVTYLLMTVLLQSTALGNTQVSSTTPLKLGVHLFVDNEYLQDMSSLEFQNGLVQKDTDNPIVVPEYPWEAGVHFYTSFLQVPANLSITGKAMYSFITLVSLLTQLFSFTMFRYA